MLDSRVLAGIALALMAACGDTANCTIVCAQDIDCPNGQTCGDGLCSGTGSCTEEEPCTPNAFLGCADDDTARVCADDGASETTDACGGFGCNAAAGRCNECAPDELACAGEDVATCSAEGLLAVTETCELACSVVGGAHCQRLAPVWIPDACETPVLVTDLVIGSTTLDTDADVTCTGGILPQVEGPEICVIRAGSIRIGDSASVSVIGRRAIALVADRLIDVEGTFDISARGRANGPGVTSASGSPSATGGGGGAGFGGLGGADGGQGGVVGSGLHGVPVDPLARLGFEGGLRAVNNTIGQSEIGDYVPVGGGGGGGALLVACVGTVSISGTIDAGGGGGAGGGRKAPQQGAPFLSGAGGGSGGYVVIQGATVNVTGRLFANGGGGGGACGSGNCVGLPGQDGAVAGVGGSGGAGTAPGTGGGDGIVIDAGGSVAGTAGQPNNFAGGAGGGGGGVGRFQIYTTGAAPTVTPAIAQPPFEPNLTVPLR